MNIIDAVSICILVLFVLFGIYKGFISTLLNIGAYFVSVVRAYVKKCGNKSLIYAEEHE